MNKKIKLPDGSIKSFYVPDDWSAAVHVKSGDSNESRSSCNKSPENSASPQRGQTGCDSLDSSMEVEQCAQKLIVFRFLNRLICDLKFGWVRL